MVEDRDWPGPSLGPLFSSLAPGPAKQRRFARDKEPAGQRLLAGCLALERQGRLGVASAQIPSLKAACQEEEIISPHRTLAQGNFRHFPSSALGQLPQKEHKEPTL